MKALVNEKNRGLFIGVSLLAAVPAIISVSMALLMPKNAMVYVAVASFFAFGGVMILIYRYLFTQNRIMENAVLKVEEIISGNRQVEFDCYEEGVQYKLFHRINSLVEILNAHIQHEEQDKAFLKDTLLDISHQIKTPLSALNIYIGIIQEEEASPVIKEFISKSECELDRIELLVQNLLKLSKIDAGTLIMERKPENVSNIMDEIEAMFSFRAIQEGKNLKLSGENDVALACDRTWMVEAMANIVKNAFDHTDNGDTVSIEWAMSASIVRVKIKDNGAGIHPEDLYHIFKRFYRSRYSKDRQGVGLGLALSKSIIEAHNGTIEVDSQLGSGTTFTINFLT